MTVLDLTPPQPNLRLVADNTSAATTTTPPAGDRRYRAEAKLHGDARSLYHHTLSYALAAQQPINADALRVVLAAKQATTALPARVFTAETIWQLMYVDIVSWCRNRQLRIPKGCARALCITIEMLDETHKFDAESDPVSDLYDAVDECTGGWHDDSASLRG